MAEFYRDWLNPYLNFHRPCAFASLELDRRGKLRKVYRKWRTPCEKLLSLAVERRGLGDDVHAAQLQSRVAEISDTDFAEQLQRRRDELLRICKNEAILGPHLIRRARTPPTAHGRRRP